MTHHLSYIIQQCQKQDPQAQKALFEQYKGLLYGICVRYINDPVQAEDVFIEGFYKIFAKISSFKGEGSFEGWMRRIMVNESLMYLRKNATLHISLDVNIHNPAEEFDTYASDFTFDDIMAVIDELPTGYRTIFNLYVVEEYKHREIAEMLGISINTSKSQLIFAKKKLQEALKKKAWVNIHNLIKAI